MYILSACERQKVVVMARLPFDPAFVFFQRARVPLTAVFAEVGMVAWSHRKIIAAVFLSS
jgi:hypothetical protein